MFIEVICFYVIQSTIAIKPGIITELIQILKSNSCTFYRVLASNILTHYCTLTSLNRVHLDNFQKITTHRCKEKDNSICSEWTVVHRMMNECYIKLSTSMIEIRDQYFFQLFVVIFNKNIFHLEIHSNQLSMLASFKAR